MIVLRFSMQGEDIFERTNGKCHVLHFSMQEQHILNHKLMTSDIYVHFSQPLYGPWENSRVSILNGFGMEIVGDKN